MTFLIKMTAGTVIYASASGLRTATPTHPGHPLQQSEPVGLGQFYDGVAALRRPRSMRIGGFGLASRLPNPSDLHSELDPVKRIDLAMAMLESIKAILELHKQEVLPARRPAATPAHQPDRQQIYSHYEKRALEGIGMFKRAERAEARRRAGAWTETEVARQWSENTSRSVASQDAMDKLWMQLCSNAPEITTEVLRQAFTHSNTPATPVGIDSDDVSIVVLIPQPHEIILEKRPTISSADNIVLRDILKREQSDYYTLFVCAQLLIAARETFAAAPGIQTAHLAALRIEGHGAYGQAKTACLMAATFRRADLDHVRWDLASADDIFNETAAWKDLDQSGPNKLLRPLRLLSEPGLAEIVAAVDFEGIHRHEPSARLEYTAINEKHEQEGVSLNKVTTMGAATPSKQLESLAISARQALADARSLTNSLLGTHGSDPTALKSRLEGAIQPVVDIIGDMLKPAVDGAGELIQRGGADEQRGRRALEHVRDSISAAKLITGNSRGRNPHELLNHCDVALAHLDAVLGEIK